MQNHSKIPETQKLDELLTKICELDLGDRGPVVGVESEKDKTEDESLQGATAKV